MSEATSNTVPAGLLQMQAEFPQKHISLLPKETKAQAEERKQNRAVGINCPKCGGWHHKNATHLDYVGHAALTKRLLECDPFWDWQPLAFDENGLPKFDQSGGLWIKLTVCGVTRLGYGHANAKAGVDAGAREKEVIGDALRNAGMRFGAALDLWSKADLHDEEEPAAEQKPSQPVAVASYPDEQFDANLAAWVTSIKSSGRTVEDFVTFVESRAKSRLTVEQKKRLITAVKGE